MNNSIITSQENKDLCAGLSAQCVAEADNPRKDLLSAWVNYIVDFAPWYSMVTLTVNNENMCYEEGFQKRVRSLIQRLNFNLYGDHYYRKVGHCYFPYVSGTEYQTRMAVHQHLLVGAPINFSLLHRIWNNMSGFALIKPVTTQKEAAEYVCKYVVKGEDLRFWQQDFMKIPRPANCPIWYLEHLPVGHPHKNTLNKFTKRLF